MDDFLFLTSFFPPIGQTYSALTGILALRSSANRLLPRAATDFTPIARLGSFSAASSFLRVGASNAATIPTPLTVRLTMPVATDTTVTVTSSDTAALTVDTPSLTIAAGQVAAEVRLTGVTASPGVTLTATLGDVSVTSSVRVLTDTEPPTALTLTPTSSTINPGATVTYTVALNLPAPVGGAVVNLTQAPAAAGTLPASVNVAANQMSATFSFVDGSTAAGTTITASYNAATATARINVIEPPSGLVINEIDYDQPGTDMDEFVEIYNGTGAAVDFTNLAIAFVNGSTAASNQPNLQYMQASLAGVGTLPAGSYLLVTKPGLVTDPALNCAVPGTGTTCILFTPTVFADNPSNPPNQPPTKPTTWPGSGIQNGDPDGVLLLNTSTGRVIDRLSYGGAMTQCKVTNIAGEISLVEGTALDPTVRDVVTGSLSRNQLGRDTNDANTDWKFTATPTPGKANPAFP